MAQSRSISGTITDGGTGEALIGATILVKGTTNGTVTDFDGKYSIDASTGDILVVSFTGYTSQELTLGEGDVLDINLEQGVLIDEIVVTGYAVETKRQTTGAVSTVKAIPSSGLPTYY